jgi:phosphoribosylformylglycinamidine cyclo-ligase
MRLPDTLAYIIDTLPRQWPIFPFMQKYGPIDDREAYGNLNMGAGYALYVPESHVDEVIGIAALLRLRAYRAGYIEASKTKKVVIRPKDLEYLGDTLGVR